jgi:diguanylate cyclase (GGDEF)-like protein
MPPTLEQAVRIASVPEPLRRFVRRIGPLRVELRAGPDAPEMPAVVELLKLRELEPDSVSVEETAGSPTTAWVERGTARIEITSAELHGPLELVLRATTRLLTQPEELVDAALSAERELAARAALAAVVEQMLMAERHDQALSIFLAGVTAGAGLGFHRAALFTKDSQRGLWVCQLGVGPADKADAHRIWESVEAESVSFRDQLSRSPAESAPPAKWVAERVSTSSPFHQRVIGMAFAPEGADEVALALAGKRSVFERPRGPQATALAALDPAPAFVLTRVMAREHVLGLLYADLRFASDRSVSPPRAESLRLFVDHAGLVWETRNHVKRVEELARHDPLTSLLNRRAFEERFSEERTRAQRGTSPLSLLLIDVDHFREINNEKGHAAGDATLRTLAALMKSELRALDVAARFGGDEIVVLLPGAGSFEAALVARRLGVAAARRSISISIGAAAFPEDTDHPDDLLGLADKNLYAAKAAGRGRVSLSPTTAPLVFTEEDDQNG